MCRAGMSPRVQAAGRDFQWLVSVTHLNDTACVVRDFVPSQAIEQLPHLSHKTASVLWE